MTFVVNTIKQGSQESQKSQNIQFLVDLESPLFVRKFVEELWLVLLSLDDYLNKPESFGPVYIVLNFENKQIRVFGKKEFTLKDLILFFLYLWLEVENANYVNEPQTPEQIKKVIEVCKNEIESQKQVEKAYAVKQEAERKVYYENDWLEKAKKVIERSLEKVNTLLLDKWAFISAKDLRIIKEKIEELKKLRMWTNYEKIRDMLQDLFSMVDHIEEDYYNSLEDSSQTLFDWTVVTSVDLEKQVSVLEKVQQQQMFWWKVPVNRKDYVAFWEILIYLKFLKKDFLKLFQNLLLYVNRIFDFLQLWLLIVIIVLWFGLVYLLLISSQNSTNIYYSLFSLGFLGIVSYIFSAFKAKNPFFVTILFIFMIVVYFVGIPILKNTFALS